MRDRQAFLGIGLVSGLALAFLVWLVYFSGGETRSPAWVSSLPALNAGLNSASALLALAGFMAIRTGQRGLHRGLMLSALGCSALFLAGYVGYHHFHGETHFGGQGWVRTCYFSILISHVALSALVLPLLLTVVWFAGMEAFARHRVLARWVLPLWLYVSVSGVAVYLFLRPYY